MPESPVPSLTSFLTAVRAGASSTSVVTSAFFSPFAVTALVMSLSVALTV